MTTDPTTNDAPPAPMFTLEEVRRAMDAGKIKFDLAELRAARDYDRLRDSEDPALASWKKMPRNLSRRDKARFRANLPGDRFDAQLELVPITDEELVTVLRPPAPTTGPDQKAAPAPARWQAPATTRPRAAAYRRDDPANPWRTGED